MATNGNGAELIGPGGIGAKLQGRWSVGLGLLALLIGVLAWFAHGTITSGEIGDKLKTRMSESQQEHEAIAKGLERMEYRMDVQTCVMTLAPGMRDSLRERWSPGALTAVCPWVGPRP